MKHFSDCWDRFFCQADDIDMLVGNWSSLFSFVIEKRAPLKRIDRMLNYVIWAAARNACMDLWSRFRACSGKSVGLLWLLVLLTARKSWKMSTIQVIF